MSRPRLKIWYLRNTTYKGDLDEIIAAIVSAPDEDGARRLLAGTAQDEGSDVWLDTAKSTIEHIGTALANAIPLVLMTESKGF